MDCNGSFPINHTSNHVTDLKSNMYENNDLLVIHMQSSYFSNHQLGYSRLQFSMGIFTFFEFQSQVNCVNSGYLELDRIFFSNSNKMAGEKRLITEADHIFT